MIHNPILFAVLGALSQVLSIGILAGAASAWTWWSVFLPKTKRRFKYLFLIAALLDLMCILGMLLAT